MGKIATEIASSHALSLHEPEAREGGRTKNLERFRSKYGSTAPVHNGELESIEDASNRYKDIRDAHDLFSHLIIQQKVTTVVIIGDDQDENFNEDNLPQLAIYTGDTFTAEARTFRSNKDVNLLLLSGLVREGFEPAHIGKLKNDELLSHAHGPILLRLLADADIRVTLVFLNAIHLPAMEPVRCYKLGVAIRKILDRAHDETFAVIGSGGLSHFTAGYPWKDYSGKFCYGDISEEFDRHFADTVRNVKVGAFARSIGSEDLLNHGELETRSWLTVAGIMGKRRPITVTYQPFFRALMGMGVAI